jgi:hypothetical protein
MSSTDQDRRYFLAAAAAISFLQRLSPCNRMNVRKIILQEDHPSVVPPESHAQGLIPFCQENSKLSVERRVEIWRTMLVPRSRFRHATTDLQHIMMWVHEARILRKRGMPATSFELVLHGPSPEASQHLHDVVVNAAILQEAALEAGRRVNIPHLYSKLPVSPDFREVVKEVLRGDVPVRFDAEMSAVWDLEKVLREHQGEWPNDFDGVFPVRDVEEPVGGWEAAREAYIEWIDPIDRMDGWQMLLDTA